MKHGSAFDQKVFADILADILDTSKESLKERVPATWSLYSLGFLQHLKLSLDYMYSTVRALTECSFKY